MKFADSGCHIDGCLVGDFSIYGVCCQFNLVIAVSLIFGHPIKIFISLIFNNLQRHKIHYFLVM